MQDLISTIKEGKFLKVSPREDTLDSSYRLNPDLYRTYDFEFIPWQESIVIFGCSTVFGLGLEKDKTISSCLERLTHAPVINMGVCGSSMQFALYNSLILRNNYPLPRAVIHVWTAATRCTKFTNNKIFNYGSWNIEEPLIKNWAEDETNVKVNALMTQQLAKQIWPTTVKYCDLTFFADTAEYTGCYKLEGIDFAKDETHPGKQTAQLTAEYISERIKL